MKREREGRRERGVKRERERGVKREREGGRSITLYSDVGR